MELKNRTSVQNALDLSFEENSLLHGIIRSGKDGLIEVLESIKESSFQNTDNKLVFSALVSLFNNGKEFDLLDVEPNKDGVVLKEPNVESEISGNLLLSSKSLSISLNNSIS